MPEPTKPVAIFVISSGRPMNVPTMVKLIDQPHTWIVPLSELGDYRKAGAEHVTDDRGGLIAGRNRALDMAAEADVYCAQLSDDLTRLRRCTNKDNRQRTELTVSEALTMMRQALESTSFRLAGIAPTDNAFFYNQRLTTDSFIVGDFILVAPSTPRFDTAMRVKEDYDFTCQHLQSYGGVARCNQILATFHHRTNRGGAVAYRTERLEQQAIGHLMGKWPGKFRENPRRKNEVLLRWR